jgi:hypothetical protein
MSRLCTFSLSRNLRFLEETKFHHRHEESRLRDPILSHSNSFRIPVTTYNFQLIHSKGQGPSWEIDSNKTGQEIARFDGNRMVIICFKKKKSKQLNSKMP